MPIAVQSAGTCIFSELQTLVHIVADAAHALRAKVMFYRVGGRVLFPLSCWMQTCLLAVHWRLSNLLCASDR